MIKLRFETQELVISRYRYHPLLVIRLIATVRFVQADGSLFESLYAIVDTGAHTSVLPLALWQRLAVEIDAEDIAFGGINDRPECRVPASLGRVKCRLTDETGQLSPELDVPCFLAKTNRVPLILGFAGLLSQFNICFNHATGVAYAEAVS
jgi:hypothetical protein